MTLREILAAYPSLFYRQTWYADEPFLDAPAVGRIRPDFLVMPDDMGATVRAADLAALYVTSPHDSRWRWFLWTHDRDRYGQRVYVGGVGQYGIETFQIHRHLTIDERWGWPC